MSTKRTGKSPSGRAAASASGSTCAECRRLKIRCDRKLPCEQCKRRGCASICPDGQLVPAHSYSSNRVIGQVPANIDAIYRKLDTYSQRIQELETALQTAQNQLTQTPHPLLAPDLVRLTQDEETPAEDESSVEGGDGADEEMIALAFGSLIKINDGTTRYLGPSAASFWLFLTRQSVAPSFEEFPALASSLSFIWPSSATRLRSQIESYLPSNTTIRSMINSYFKYSLSLFQPLTPSQFTDDIVVPSITALSSPQLSLLLIVLALASQLDPSPSPEWLSPSFYYTLSRAALTIEEIHVNTAIETVEAIGLQSLFLLGFDKHAIPERAWGMLGLAMRCALAMGLHRDCRRWGLPEGVGRRRRRTFFELWTYDILLSACLGRPPSLSRYQVDCEMPMDDAVTLGQNPAFYRWKHQIWSSILLEITVTALSPPKPPAYSTVVSLDKQFRASPLPDRLSGAADPCHQIDRNAYPQLSTRWQEHFVRMLNSYTLILLHRPFFARALLEGADDLFKHRFLRSVMTIHDSSRDIVRHVVWMSAHEPDSLQACILWEMSTICGLVSLGALLIKAPNCSLATSCIQDLDTGIKFLMECETVSCGAINMLAKLYTSAHNAMHSVHGEQYAPSPEIHQLAKRRLQTPEKAVMQDIHMSPPENERPQRQPQPRLVIPAELMVPSDSHNTPAPTSPAPSITIMSPPLETPQTSNHSSPFAVTMLGNETRRSEGLEAPAWHFNDYVAIHTNQLNRSNPMIEGLPTPDHLNLAFSPSHLSPSYGSDVESNFPSPYTRNASYRHDAHPHPSGPAVPATYNNNQLESISWEQFMLSIGL